MGYWGKGTYDSDSALDYMYTLEKSILDTLSDDKGVEVGKLFAIADVVISLPNMDRGCDEDGITRAVLAMLIDSRGTELTAWMNSFDNLIAPLEEKIAKAEAHWQSLLDAEDEMFKDEVRARIGSEG